MAAWVGIPELLLTVTFEKLFKLLELPLSVKLWEW